ncbi:MAG TPA: hypothetical protein VK081_12485 [Planctomycetota bacterium]|nr:hypothetical protein [Planctomycetota bacterium]
MVVLSAFALTLVFAGPRALAVTRARMAELSRSLPRGPLVALDRVGFAAAPDWLRGDLLTAVALDLAPVLSGHVGLTDEAEATRLLAGLHAVPWVRSASLQRVYPDRLRARLDLRRPVARLALGDRAQAFDAEGVCLPCPDRVELPLIDVLRPEPGVPGQRHHDAAVVHAAAVAAEWARDVAPRVEGAPALVRVDTRNLDYRADPAHWCEVRVALARADGGVAWFDYDHPPGSTAPRVAPEVKARVLRAVLDAHPGLAGVAAADLRFPNRWQAWVRAEAPPAPP